MRTMTVLLAIISLASADWTTVGGNSEHNGLCYDEGPTHGAMIHEGWSPYSTLGMQVYAEGSLAVTMRYDFGTMTGTLACHELPTAETLWTRVYGPAQSKILPIGFRDNRIYCRNFKETGNDTVYCIAPQDGSILWQSRWTVERGITWAANYTPDGDIILAGSGAVILCLDKETGDTVWTRYRPLPNTGAEWMCVHDSILYTWTGFINRPKKLLAISTNTGAILDSSPELPGDGDQEWPFAVGPDGVIYCQRDGGLLHALTYNSAGFHERWSRTSGGGVWMSFGVSQYGLYAPMGRRLYRLYPASGLAFDSSPELVGARELVPRISIDRDNYLFVMATTGDGEGKLWALTPDLDTLWHEDYPYAYYSGPAFTSGLFMIMAPAGALMRVYEHPMAVEEREGPAADGRRLTACPNPAQIGSTVALRLGETRDMTQTSDVWDRVPSRVAVYDALGRLVHQSAITGPQSEITLDLRGLHAGTYYCRVGSETARLTLTE